MKMSIQKCLHERDDDNFLAVGASTPSCFLPQRAKTCDLVDLAASPSPVPPKSLSDVSRNTCASSVLRPVSDAFP